MIFLPMITKSRKMSKIPTQLLGVAVLGCAIWVLVDKPGFLDLFEQVHSVQSIQCSKPPIQAESMLPNLDGKFDISLYTSAVYIIIVVAAIVSIIAFFGCFGAVKVKLKLNCIFFICGRKGFNAAAAAASLNHVVLKRQEK